MSCWDFLCSPKSPETPASGRKHQHCKRRWFRDSGSHIGIDLAASRLSEVRSPHVVIALYVGCAESLAPHDVIGGIDYAVLVKISDCGRAAGHAKPAE